MDVVALAQHGVDYAVATLGTATTPVHVQKLFRADRHASSSASTATPRAARRHGARSRTRCRCSRTARTRSSCSCPTARIRTTSSASAARPRSSALLDARDAAVRIPARRALGAASADLRRGPRRARRGRASLSGADHRAGAVGPAAPAAVRPHGLAGGRVARPRCTCEDVRPRDAADRFGRTVAERRRGERPSARRPRWFAN